MGPGLVEVREGTLLEHPAKVRLIEDHDVIEALSPGAAEPRNLSQIGFRSGDRSNLPRFRPAWSKTEVEFGPEGASAHRVDCRGMV